MPAGANPGSDACACLLLARQVTIASSVAGFICVQSGRGASISCTVAHQDTGRKMRSFGELQMVTLQKYPWQIRLFLRPLETRIYYFSCLTLLVVPAFSSLAWGFCDFRLLGYAYHLIPRSREAILRLCLHGSWSYGSDEVS